MQNAIESRNAAYLCHLFKIPGIRYNLAQTATPHGHLLQDQRVSSKPYDEILQLQLQLLASYGSEASSKWKECYRLKCTIFLTFMRHFSLAEGNWELPLFKLLCLNIFHLGMKVGELEETARHLSRAFTLTITDRALLETSKKWGAVFIILLLFRIYFKAFFLIIRQLGNYRLCSNALRALENPQLEFPELSEFPSSEEVAFRYFRGRIHVQQQEFKLAEGQLQLAFAKCHKNAHKNKRLILCYLIVCKVFHGKLPKINLLVRYSLADQFQLLCTAVKQGNLRQYSESLMANSQFFMKLELFLILQTKFKNILYRNLFRTIYKLNGSSDNKLFLVQMQAALEFVSNPADLNEVECICANLIYDGFIKGYISHEKRVVVLSKKNPFPSLSQFL